MRATPAEPLGDRGGDPGTLQPLQRRLIGRRDDDHRTGQTLGAEVVIDELLHLAAALADQGDHVDVCFTVARDHAQQRALADTRAGEDAHALAEAAGEQAVQSAYTRGQRRANRLATERVRRGVGDSGDARGVERPLAVDRPRESVDDATEQLLANGNREPATAGKHGGAWSHAMRVGERHQDQPLIAEADDLGGDARATSCCPLGVEVADVAERQSEAFDLDAQADDLDDAALEAQARGACHELAVRREIKHRYGPRPQKQNSHPWRTSTAHCRAAQAST